MSAAVRTGNKRLKTTRTSVGEKNSLLTANVWPCCEDNKSSIHLFSSVCYDFYHRACGDLRYVQRDELTKSELAGDYQILICRYTRSGRNNNNIDFRRTVRGTMELDDATKIHARASESCITEGENDAIIRVSFDEANSCHLPFPLKNLVLRVSYLDDEQFPYAIFRQPHHNITETPGRNTTVYAHLSKFTNDVAVGLLRDGFSCHHRKSPVQFRTLAEARSINERYIRMEGSEHWLSRYRVLPVELVAKVRCYLCAPPVFFFRKGDLQLLLSWFGEDGDRHEITIVSRPVV